ncbi:MAG: hypothetical protein V4819_07145 [Verrucomicrobiota bacterium]
MKPALKIAAHLSVGVAAFLLMASITKQDRPRNFDPVRQTRSADRTQPGSANKQGPAGKAVKVRMKAAEYQAAWDAIAARKWGKGERMEYQMRLLKEWAETDLEGALKAAFSETWNRGNVRMVGESFTFQRAFDEVFVDRSEDVLKLIQQRKTGILESSLLLEAWAGKLLYSKDRSLYFTYLRGMNGDDFIKVLGAGSSRLKEREFLMTALDLLAEKVGQGTTLEGLDPHYSQSVGEQLSKEELLERLRNPDDKLSGFYTSILAEKYSAASRYDSADDVRAEIGSLPEANRGTFARALLDSYSRNPAMIQTALDQLVTTQQWQFLDKEETSNSVRTMAQTMDPVYLAEWAVNLPPREETSEMFHRGVEPYIRKSPEEAWNWIQEMDDGYWRDRALAEYSQINLHVFNDPAKSAAAIAQIRDPAFLETVKGWRASWEKQRPR